MPFIIYAIEGIINSKENIMVTETKYEASPHSSNSAYKALKPLKNARKDYVIIVAQRLIKEHGLAYATVANILGTHEPQLRRWLGK